MAGIKFCKNINEYYTFKLPSDFYELVSPTAGTIWRSARINSDTELAVGLPDIAMSSSTELTFATEISVGEPTVTTTGPTVVDYDVTANDCSIRLGLNGLSLNGEGLWIGTERTAGQVTGNYKSWMPFEDIAIPQGATIVSATLSIISLRNHTEAVSAFFGCDNTANAVTPTTYNDLNMRTMTANFTSIDAIENYTTGSTYSYDVTATVQDIISLPAWVSGNTLAIMVFHGSKYTTGLRYFASSQNPTYDGPKLEISYSV